MLQNELTIDERMKRIHTRIQLEKISGISAGKEKELFLDFCQKWEKSGVAINAPEERNETEIFDRNGNICRAFDKWNDAPIFALKRRKVQVG